MPQGGDKNLKNIIKRTYLFSVFLIFCLVLLSPVSAQEDTTGLSPLELIKNQFEEKLSEYIKMPVVIGEISMGYSSVEAKQVTIGSKADKKLPWIKTESISATCNFMSLIGGNLEVEELKLDKVFIRIAQNKKSSFTKKGKSKKTNAERTSTTEASNFPLNKLVATNIKVEYWVGSNRSLILDIPDFKIDNTKEEAIITFAGSFSKNNSHKKFCKFKALFKADTVIPFAGSGKIDCVKSNLSDVAGLMQLFKPLPWLKPQAVTGFAEATAKLVFSAKTKAKNKLWLKFTNAGIKVANIDFNKMQGQASIYFPVNESLTKLVLSGNANLTSGIVTITGETSADPYLLPFKNFSTNFKYSKANLAFTNSQTDLFGGKIQGYGNINFNKKPVKYFMDLTGANLRAESFLQTNSSQKQAISGPVNAWAKFTGNITGLLSLNGNGNMEMKSGNYSAPPVVTPMLSLINLKQFSSGEIEGADASFKLINGKLHTKDANVRTPAGKGFYNGYVGLDTVLSGKMNLVFSELAVQKSKVLQEISLNSKTVSVPSKVRGTLLTPEFPGFKPGKLFELGIKRKGQKMLQDILFGKPKPKTTPVEPKQEPEKPKEKPKPEEKIKKSIENELKKIFKF